MGKKGEIVKVKKKVENIWGRSVWVTHRKWR